MQHILHRTSTIFLWAPFSGVAGKATSHWQVRTGRSCMSLQSSAHLHSLSLPLSVYGCCFVCFWDRTTCSLKKLRQCFLRVYLWCFLSLVNKPGSSVISSFQITSWQTKAVLSNYLLTQLFSTPKYLLLRNNVQRNDAHACQFSSSVYHLGLFFYQIS